MDGRTDWLLIDWLIDWLIDFVVTLQVLYKLKTAKVFDTTKSRAADCGENLFAVNMMYLCAESRLLCVAGAEHVLLFRFSKQENTIDCPVCCQLRDSDRMVMS